ncbi:nitroreductase family deazaflavin-dependent oxidoreductase [Actinomadura sp. NPDC047616]|uniref:nitroreductase family deazaflavin-dependent oxidoreductase n=1 Tax=Actinomadura sp. NPDC047616 TaxID=3155914 RepID=UPI0033C49679
MSKPRPAHLDNPAFSRFMKVTSAAHVALYRLSGGRLGRRFPRSGAPVCLLTTIGRRSGTHRTKPLLYMQDDDRVVIVASVGGHPRHPAWYHNLTANPNVLVQIGPDRRPMRARTADASEREALWPRLVAMYPDYADYQSWTDREIPVVICEPEVR